jgi:transposase
MEKVEIRAVIKYLCKKGMSSKEILENFMDTLRRESPSYSTVKKWAAEFKRGRESIEDGAAWAAKRGHQRSCARSGHVQQKTRPAKHC